MFAWGITTIGLGFTKNFAGVTAVRFILGMFEAGLFPGLVYYLTFWYKTDERSIRVAFILASATLAGAFGGAIAYGVGHMNQVHGMSAWRWLLVLEGIPSCLSSLLVWFFMPDYPETVKWLNPDEKAMAIRRLEKEGSHGHSEDLTWSQAKDTLTDWRLYAHYAVSDAENLVRTFLIFGRSISGFPRLSPVCLCLRQVSLLVSDTKVLNLSL